MRWVTCEGLHLASIDVQAAQVSQDVRDQIEIEEEVLKRHGRALLADSGKALACVGVWPLCPGVGQAWMLASDAALKHPVAMARGCVDLLATQTQYHRIQATVEDGHDAGVRFLEWLGFRYEATMECYGPPPTYSDYLLFARLNHVRH